MINVITIGFPPRQAARIRAVAERLGICVIDGGSIDDGSNQSRNARKLLHRHDAWVLWNPGFSRHINGLIEAAGQRLLCVRSPSAAARALVALKHGKDPRK